MGEKEKMSNVNGNLWQMFGVVKCTYFISLLSKMIFRIIVLTNISVYPGNENKYYYKNIIRCFSSNFLFHTIIMFTAHHVE